MKKILILTASTGEGHNQAAKTLEGEFSRKGYECHKVDLFKSTHQTMDILMADGYRILASNLPRMYGRLYRQCDSKRFNSLIAKRVLKITEMRIHKIIQRVNPDLIIATHPFAVPVVGNMKAKGRCKLPFIQVVTDFKAHYAYVDPNVDAYITASEYTKSGLIKRGIASERVYAYGIPVKDAFLNSDKGRKRFEGEDPFELLIMGGSMGLKPIQKVVRLVTINQRNIHMTVVCGNNHELKEKMEEEFSSVIESGKMDLLGFVTNIPELMENAHLIITKPGGLTSSEAINMSIPMLIPFSIPGQEQENTEFLVESGMAIAVEELSEINQRINQLMDEPHVYERMSRNMNDLSRNYSLQKIVELVDQTIDSPAEIFRKPSLRSSRLRFFERVQ